MMHCPKCYADVGVKNGFVKGVQRYKCNNCGCQYTRPTPHGQPIKTKIFALVLYLTGVSMNMTGRIIGVTGQSVMRWIKAYGLTCMQEQLAEIEEEIGIDEMHHFVGKKRDSLGVESTWHTTGRLLGWECGDRSSATLEKLYDRSGLWAEKRVYTDRFQAYSEVIGAKRLWQGKPNTYKTEQNNGRQRHWLGRCHRKTIIVSKSIEMVNASIALFKRFRVNTDIMELISLLR